MVTEWAATVSVTPLRQVSAIENRDQVAGTILQEGGSGAGFRKQQEQEQEHGAEVGIGVGSGQKDTSYWTR